MLLYVMEGEFVCVCVCTSVCVYVCVCVIVVCVKFVLLCLRFGVVRGCEMHRSPSALYGPASS